MLLREVILRNWVFYMMSTCKYECEIFWSMTLCISVRISVDRPSGI